MHKQCFEFMTCKAEQYFTAYQPFLDAQGNVKSDVMQNLITVVLLSNLTDYFFPSTAFVVKNCI